MDFFTLFRSLETVGLEIFTLNDVVKLTGQKKEVVVSMLSRWVKQKKVFRLKNQYYSMKQIENKFLYQRLFPSTYIGLHSALEYYGSTTQRFTNLDLVTKNVLYGQTVENTKVTFHKVRNALFFGFNKVSIGQTDIFISNFEKTMIDCIFFLSKVYLSETNAFISEFRNKIDLELLRVYLNKLNSPVLNKRAGFLLEQNHLVIQNLHINNKYERLNSLLGDSGPRDKKWKLIINEDF